MCPGDKNAVDKYVLYTPRLDLPFLTPVNFRWTSVKKNVIYIGVGVRGTAQARRFTTCMRTKELRSLLIKIVSQDITNPDKYLLGQLPHFCIDVGWRFDCSRLYVGAENIGYKNLEFIHEVITKSTFVFMTDVNILTDNIQRRFDSNNRF